MSNLSQLYLINEHGDLSFSLCTCCFCYRKPTEGQLSKWTNLMKGWQFRWFTLDPDSGLLEYYVVRIIDQWLISCYTIITWSSILLM